MVSQIDSHSEQRQAFLSLKSPREVAELLGYRYSAFVYQIYKTPDDKKYNVFKLRFKIRCIAIMKHL